MAITLGHFDIGWVKGFIEIAEYQAPDGTHPHKMPGGLHAVDSRESGNTDLGNNNLHEGYWLKTHTAKKQRYFIFIPDPTQVHENKPGKSLLWHTFIVQHDNGSRQDLAPETVVRELRGGVIGD